MSKLFAVLLLVAMVVAIASAAASPAAGPAPLPRPIAAPQYYYGGLGYYGGYLYGHGKMDDKERKFIISPSALFTSSLSSLSPPSSSSSSSATAESESESNSAATPFESRRASSSSYLSVSKKNRRSSRDRQQIKKKSKQNINMFVDSETVEGQRDREEHGDGEREKPEDKENNAFKYFEDFVISSKEVEDSVGYPRRRKSKPIQFNFGPISEEITATISPFPNTASSSPYLSLPHGGRLQSLHHHRSRIKFSSDFSPIDSNPRLSRRSKKQQHKHKERSFYEESEESTRRGQKRRRITSSTKLNPSSASASSSSSSLSSFSSTSTAQPEQSSSSPSRFLLTFLSSCHLVQVTSRLVVALAMTSLLLILVHVMPGAYCSSSTMSQYSPSVLIQTTSATGAAATKRAYFNQTLIQQQNHRHLKLFEAFQPLSSSTSSFPLGSVRGVVADTIATDAYQLKTQQQQQTWLKSRWPITHKSAKSISNNIQNNKIVGDRPLDDVVRIGKMNSKISYSTSHQQPLAQNVNNLNDNDYANDNQHHRQQHNNLNRVISSKEQSQILTDGDESSVVVGGGNNGVGSDLMMMMDLTSAKLDDSKIIAANSNNNNNYDYYNGNTNNGNNNLNNNYNDNYENANTNNNNKNDKSSNRNNNNDVINNRSNYNYNYDSLFLETNKDGETNQANNNNNDSNQSSLNDKNNDNHLLSNKNKINNQTMVEESRNSEKVDTKKASHANTQQRKPMNPDEGDDDFLDTEIIETTRAGSTQVEQQQQQQSKASTVKVGITSANIGGGGGQRNNGTTKAERDIIANVSSTGVRPTMAFTNSYFGKNPDHQQQSLQQEGEEFGGEEEMYGGGANHEYGWGNVMQSDQSETKEPGFLPVAEDNNEKDLRVEGGGEERDNAYNSFYHHHLVHENFPKKRRSNNNIDDNVGKLEEYYEPIPFSPSASVASSSSSFSSSLPSSSNSPYQFHPNKHGSSDNSPQISSNPTAITRTTTTISESSSGKLFKQTTAAGGGGGNERNDRTFFSSSSLSSSATSFLSSPTTSQLTKSIKSSSSSGFPFSSSSSSSFTGGTRFHYLNEKRSRNELAVLSSASSSTSTLIDNHHQQQQQLQHPHQHHHHHYSPHTSLNHHRTHHYQQVKEQEKDFSENEVARLAAVGSGLGKKEYDDQILIDDDLDDDDVDEEEMGDDGMEININNNNNKNNNHHHSSTAKKILENNFVDNSPPSSQPESIHQHPQQEFMPSPSSSLPSKKSSTNYYKQERSSRQNNFDDDEEVYIKSGNGGMTIGLRPTASFMSSSTLQTNLKKYGNGGGGSNSNSFVNDDEKMAGDDPSVITNLSPGTSSQSKVLSSSSSSSASGAIPSSSFASFSSTSTTASTFNNSKQRPPLQIRRDLSRLIASGGRVAALTSNNGGSLVGPDEDPMPNKCDRVFNSNGGGGGMVNGTFESPTMISEEGHLYQCIFMFVAKKGERVEVVFTQFNVRGTPPECVHEWVDIWTEVEGMDPTDLVTTPFSGRYCGKIPPRRRISLYGGIAIGFYSDKNSTDETIFRGTFAFINESIYQIGTPVHGTDCSYTINGALQENRNGDLISPTYPGVYPKNLSCSYIFIGVEGQRIRLEFRDFDIFYGGAHCPFDEVKVYDGLNLTNPLIGTYCGQQRNLVVFSSAQHMLVTFTTLERNTEAQNRGFKGVWEFSESFVKLDFIVNKKGTHIRGTECDQRILSKGQSNGEVYSPNYPFPYVPKIVCRYFIYGLQDPQHLERVRLSFEKFDVETSVSKISSEEDTINQSEIKKCGDGFLKVYLKGQEVIQAYDKADYEFCGKEVPHDVVSDGPRLVLVFSSGDPVGSGFKARYQFETEYRVPGTAAPDGSCHFTYYSTSRIKGEFNSPRFPSNYPSMTNCTYIFFQQPNEQVRIVFDNFKMKSEKFNYTDRGAYGEYCEEDWVEVWNVISDADDRLVGRYCGSTAPGPIESRERASALKVILHTDDEGVSSGFKARYIYFNAKSIFGECGQNITQAQSGVLTSPKWPQKYDGPSKGEGSATCNWYLSVRPGSRVMLHFQNFAIEGEPNGRGCPAAAVRIWVDPDGVPVELCGEALVVENSQYTSTRNVMRVTFITADKAVGAPGFRAVWTEVQEVPGAPCHHSYFRCEKSLFCIPAELRCDDTHNCGTMDGIVDHSDEEQCGLEFGDMNTIIAIVVGVALSLFFIVLVCALVGRKRRRRRRRLQLRRPPIHVCDNAGARFAAMDSV